MLGFGGVVEGSDAADGTSVRIDDATAPGRVDDAHAALQPYLATGAPVETDAVGSDRGRVATMIYDVDGQVVRLRLEPTTDGPTRQAYEI